MPTSNVPPQKESAKVPKPKQPLILTPASATLAIGETQQFLLTGGITGNPSWASSAPGIVSVDQNGLATALDVGSVTITVTSGSRSASAIVTVEATEPPEISPIPPVAQIVVDQIVDVTMPVVFNTVGSEDPDGELVSGELDCGDATIIPWTAPLPQYFEHTYAASGTKTATLTVVDDGGRTATASVTFDVPDPPDPPPPLPAPKAVLAYVSGGLVGQPYVLSTDGTTRDLTSYDFDQGDGTPHSPISGDVPATLAPVYAIPGVYTAILTVVDPNGTGVATIPITIQAAPVPNQSPIAKLALQAGFYLGDSFVASTAGTQDLDGTIASYAYNRGDGTGVSASGPPPAIFAYTYPATGSYTATLVVTDDKGASAQATLVILVQPLPPASGGGNAYYESLIALPEHYRSASLRDPAQLATKANGGYAYCNSCALDVVYDAGFDAAKATIGTNTNSLRNQLRIPLGTQDGHTYFAVWDVYYTNSYLPSVTQLVNHKAYQFAASGSTQVFEVRTRFDGGNKQDGSSGPVPGFNNTVDISAIDARCYQPGPGTTKAQPMLPQAGTFIMKPNVWTRFFVLISQTGSTDFVSLWVADENRDPVQIQNAGAILIPTGGLTEFWVELNTSTDAIAPGRGPMINYVRNWVVLLDVASVAPYLVKP